MHSNDFDSTPMSASEATKPAWESMRELAARELLAIGGGRTRGASPALITDPVPPPRAQQ
jgi:hypothetical protein